MALSVKQLGTGRTHACALFGNGRVKCWGGNEFGKLGQGDLQNRGDGPDEMGSHLLTVDIGVGRTAAAVAVGQEHTCVILDNGRVKCWGSNASGQLGLGDTRSRGDWLGDMGDDLATVDLGTGRTAVRLAAGRSHTCALLDDGTVKCWGGNESGQLGLGDTQNRGDEPNEMGDNLPAVQLGTGVTITSVVSGAFSAHSCAMLSGYYSAKCWGANGAGQLGLGDTQNRGDGPDEMGDNLLATPHWGIATGSECTCGTGPDNHSIECAGSGSMCGAGPASESGWRFVLAGYGNSQLTLAGTSACTSQGPSCWSSNTIQGWTVLPLPLRGGKTVTALSTSDRFTCVINNGYVQCWGANDEGQLGVGDAVDRQVQDDLPPVSLW